MCLEKWCTGLADKLNAGGEEKTEIKNNVHVWGGSVISGEGKRKVQKVKSCVLVI